MMDELKVRISVDGAEQAQASLSSIASAETKVADATKAAGEAAAQTAPVSESRGQKIAQLREQLAGLFEEEVKHERAVTAGLQPTQDDVRLADVRKQKITELTRTIKDHEEAQRRMQKAIGGASESGTEFESAFSKMGWSMKGLTHEVAAFVTGLIGVDAAKELLLKFFEAWTEAAKKAHEATVQAGRDMSDLVSVLGGTRGEAMHTKLIKLADQQFLNKEQFPVLQQGVAAQARLTPGATDDQLMASAIQQARLLRAGGPGGADTVDIARFFQTQLGFSEEQSYNATSTLSNNKSDLDVIRQIIQKTGASSGEDVIGMMLALKKNGIHVEGKLLPGLLDQLSATQHGHVADALKRLGITDPMSITERIRHIAAGIKGGTLNPQRVQEALGGSLLGKSNVELTTQLAGTISDGSFAAGRASLNDTHAIQHGIEQKLQSESAAAAERQGRRDFINAFGPELYKSGARQTEMDEARTTRSLEDAHGNSFEAWLRRSLGVGEPTFFRRTFSEDLDREIAAQRASATSQPIMVIQHQTVNHIGQQTFTHRPDNMSVLTAPSGRSQR